MRFPKHTFLVFITLIFLFLQYVFWVTIFVTKAVDALVLQIPSVYFYLRLVNKKHKFNKKVLKTAFIIFIIFVSFSLIMFFAKKYVVLERKSKMNYVFWSDVYGLPRNETDLEYCRENNIDFVVPINEAVLENKTLSYVEKLLFYNIDVYICLLVSDYANLDNSHELLNFYKKIREEVWFLDKINEIYIDAELSTEYREEFSRLPLNKRLVYLSENYPSDYKYYEAVKEYAYLISLIKEDNKDFGVIRSVLVPYEVNKMMRNVPFEDLDIDIEVSMVYRESKEESIVELDDYWFYQNVQKEDGHIFIGSFERGYDCFRKDLTICSHFGKERVYLYDYRGFKKRFDLEELKPLKHCVVEYTILRVYEYFTWFYCLELLNIYLTIVR